MPSKRGFDAAVATETKPDPVPEAVDAAPEVERGAPASDPATEEETASKDMVIHITKEEEDVNAPESADGGDPMGEGMGGAVGPDGEIDWDCPCLAGMTQGPCGDSFKEAFSCFVYSEDEPKGNDCMDNFKAMHDCLQENSEYYAQDDDDDKEKGAKKEEAKESDPKVASA